ncbi:hypothetical protein [Nitrospira moscoviensis]|nr:hypothetical protein [Nitrospira moscoviensis]
MMVTTRQARASFGMVVGAALMIGVSGCDYWPPALQAQIEQLRSETQSLTLEKTQLQSQVNELARAKQDLQIQLDDLSRVNREKTGTIASLQHQVDQLRAKAVKAMAPKAPAKAAAKPTTKPVAKQPAKKKTSTKKT